MAAGLPFENEFRFQRGDGVLNWVLARAVPIRSDAGKVEGYVGTVTDITERKVMEETLRVSEERFRRLAEETEQVFWFVEFDPERAVFVNPAFERIWGVKAEDLYRDPRLWMEAIHPEDRSRVDGLWSAWIEGRKAGFDVEYRIVQPDRSVRWIHDRGTLFRDAQGRACRASGISDDISERKHTEHALIESQGILQSTMDALSAHIAILDEHGSILIVNRAWRRFADENHFPGANHGVGMNYLRVCDAAQGPWSGEAALVAEGIRDVINGLRVDFRMEYPCHAATEERWFQLRVTRLHDSHPVRLAVAHENVTEIKRAEHSLRELSGRLLRMQDDERRRIARELHDVMGQNLSATALNLARLQKLQSHGDEKASLILSDSLALTEQCLRDIRTLSYLLHPPFLDDAGLVEALSWFVEGFTKRSGIRVDLVALPEVGRLSPDAETALFRVVQESLTNIHRHSGSQTASIQLARVDGEVTLEIKDQGGKRELGKQDDNGKTTVLGVGIIGMKERLRQLGGHLEILHGDHGTTVRATLPMREAGR